MATDASRNDLPQTFPVALPPGGDDLAPDVDHLVADVGDLAPDIDHLVTEDDIPVDSFFSEKQFRLLTEPLYSSQADWSRQRSFVAAANVGLFFVVRNPAWVPDVLLSMDVALPPDLRAKRHRSYFLWEYGKPPDVIVEVVSNLEGGEDTRKLAAYARGRVPYYVIFDPERMLRAEALRGYRLDAVEFRRMDEPLDFPSIGLGLQLWEGLYEGLGSTWLRWVDARGVPILTGQERAEAERQHAEDERRRAEDERRRADRLAEQLRQLGVEPKEH